MPRTAEPITQLTSGLWQIRYRDPAGRGRKASFAKYGDARKALETARGQMREGSWIAPEKARTTLAVWVEQWRATVVHLRPSTLARYNDELDRHVLPRFGRMPLNRLTPTMVREWLAEMVAAGVPAWTVRRRFGILRRVLNAAVADEMLARNPRTKVTPPPPPRSEIVVLSAEEVAELAEAIHPWFRTWVYVAAYTGLRWSEMLGLRRSDVDLVHRTVTVRQQLNEVKGEFIGFGEPKSAAGRRTIDLPRFLCTLLEDQLAERSQPGSDGLVFVNTRGRSPHASSFHSQTWAKARAKVGRPDLRWHDLRHTSAALAIAQGAHPKLLQERMGHSTIRVTFDVYGHLLPGLGGQIADGLDEAFERAAKGPVAGAPVAAFGAQRRHKNSPRARAGHKNLA